MSFSFHTPNSFCGINLHIYVNNYYLVSLDVIFSYTPKAQILHTKFTNLINKYTEFKDKENFVLNLKEFTRILLKTFSPAIYMYELLPEFEKLFPVFSTRKEISEFLGISTSKTPFHSSLRHKIYLDLIMDRDDVYGDIFKDKSINIVTNNNKAEVIYDSSLRCVYEYDSRANKINYFY